MNHINQYKKIVNYKDAPNKIEGKNLLLKKKIKD